MGGLSVSSSLLCGGLWFLRSTSHALTSPLNSLASLVGSHQGVLHAQSTLVGVCGLVRGPTHHCCTSWTSGSGTMAVWPNDIGLENLEIADLAMKRYLRYKVGVRGRTSLKLP